MRILTWNILQPLPEAVEKLSASLNISSTLAKILANRQILTPEEADNFLNPSLDHLHDPGLMQGMPEAIQLLTRAIREGEHILVFGDYDVDGVTGTTLLVSFLRRFNDRVSYYIPHRVQEGYGLQLEKIRQFAAEGGKLVLTTDCGISNVAEVKEGRALGLSFIITDHHESQQQLPPAEAILNPRQPGCHYPYKHLAGVGIAFKLVQGVSRHLGLYREGASPTTDDSLLDYLDLVALGTVADMVPLQGENRILVKYGLEELSRTSRVGLQALKEVSGINSRPLKTTHIGFALGPRINAAGRLGRAAVAVELLLENNPGQAIQLANSLNQENRRRQQVELQILQESIDQTNMQPGILNDDILILSSPEWHPGVIGIVASKLAERYSKPTILISTNIDPGKGSARSVPKFDIFSPIRKCQHLLVAFGGHSYAAGLSIKEENIPLFRRELNSIAYEDSESPRPIPSLDIDEKVGFDKLRSPLFTELRQLLPFGSMNPEPLFITERVFLARPPRTIGNNHLRLSLNQKPYVKQAIGFNMGGLLGSFSQNLAVNVAYSMDLNPYPPGNPPQLRLRDIQFPYLCHPSDARR